MKLTIFNLVTDTDDGTNTWSYGSRAEAEQAYVDIINSYVDQYEIPPADNFDEAKEAYEQIYDEGCIDTICFEQTEVEFGPKAPKPGLKRFYVTCNWHDFPEGGTYGTVVWASSHENAEFLTHQEMATSYAEGCDVDDFYFYDCQNFDEMVERMYGAHHFEWHVVDCFPLDDFIQSQLSAA